MEKVFITGSNGFLGSFVAETLSKNGFDVYCLVRKTSNLRWVKDLKVNFVYGDITDKDSLIRNLSNMDYVIHTSGLKRTLFSHEYFKVNQIGTLNLMESCVLKSPNLKRLVYVSSLAVSGTSGKNKQLTEEDECKPITYYGKSKLFGETEARKFMDKLPITILRPPAIYGPRDEDILTFFKLVAKGVKLVLADKNHRVNFCYVEDVVDAILTVMSNEMAIGKTYFITDEKPYSLDEIGDEIAKCLGTKPIRIAVPKPLLYVIAGLNELIGKIIRKPATLNLDKVKEITGIWLCSSEKIKKELGWTNKTSLKDGIRKTAEWYKKEKWI